MTKFTINKAIIEQLEHYFRVVDETNRIMKHSFFGNYNPNKTNNINNKTNNKMKNNNLNNTNCNSKKMNYSKEELECSFKEIKTFADACRVLDISFDANSRFADVIALTSKASAAMFKLNIVKKALNLGYDLHLTKDHIYYPYNQFILEDSTYFGSEIDSNRMEIIGTIESEGTVYKILGGRAGSCEDIGLGAFCPSRGVCFGSAYPGFLGCATKEIAKHFSIYFGALITEAKYGDVQGFEIISSKYSN